MKHSRLILKSHEGDALATQVDMCKDKTTLLCHSKAKFSTQMLLFLSGSLHCECLMAFSSTLPCILSTFSFRHVEVLLQAAFQSVAICNWSRQEEGEVFGIELGGSSLKLVYARLPKKENDVVRPFPSLTL